MKKLPSLLQVLDASEKNGHTIVPIMDGLLPVPMQKKSEEVRVVIADADGTGYIQNGMDYQERMSEEGQWSKQALSALKIQYEAAQNHSLNQWLTKLFNLERGIYAVSNYCACNGISNFVAHKKSVLKEDNRIGGTYTEQGDIFLTIIGQQLLLDELNHQETDMQELDKILDLLGSGKIPAVTLNPNCSPKETQLVHELTHAADNGMSKGKLFRKICDIETKHAPALSFIHKQIQAAQEVGSYLNTDDYYSEILARVVERKTADPESFKKFNPLMNAYLEDVFYPLCMVRACGSAKAEEMSQSQELLYGALLKEHPGSDDAKLNSKEYMKTEFAQHLLEHMKRFHNTNITQYVNEGIKLPQITTQRMQEQNLQLNKKHHKRKNTILLERALELATPQGGNSSVDSVIQKASTEILRKYRHISKSEKT